jgi:2-oxoglutarate ferredoxin oxidoreductase subunit beta
MKQVFSKTATLSTLPFPYCPGCTHGIILRLVAEVIDELTIRQDVIGMCGVGCAGRGWLHIDCDMVGGPHGRTPAIATALKRCHPDALVFSYQGDGDLIAIGTAEIVHAAARSERITVIMANNGSFGATGGQMSPTTPLGQTTATFPEGRDSRTAGFPIRVAELIATVAQEAYVARTAVNKPANIVRTKKAIAKAFEVQLKDEGFSFVEVLGACPTTLRLRPIEAMRWIDERMIPYFPLGEFSTPPRRGQECLAMS